MSDEHTNAVAHIKAAATVLQNNPTSNHPILDQLVQAGMQLLIAALMAYIQRNTPTHTPSA